MNLAIQNNNMNTIYRFVAATVFAAAMAVVPAAQAKMSKALNDTASTGMNAIDHVLQKPLGSPVYEQKRFGDHLFISAGGAISSYGHRPVDGFRPGLQAEISLGDWITPAHGWRMNLDGGVHSRFTGEDWKVFGAVSADYLMNFSSLLRGDNPDRRVEVIGALGAEYQRIRYNGLWGNKVGLRAALQLRFNVQRNIYIYAEPRLSLLAGTRFSGDGQRRFRPDLSFNIGLGYRLLNKQQRLDGASQFDCAPDDHLFFGVGGGVWAFTRNGSQEFRHPNGFGSFFAGKFFSPTAGLRLKGELGNIGGNGIPHRTLAIGSLNFVWNLNSAFGGYRPGQVFDMSLNLGPVLAYAGNVKGNYYPGAEASITALFRLTPEWGIFIEPEARMFTGKFSRELDACAHGPFLSVSAGLRYTIGNFSHNYPESYTDYLKARNNFLTFAVAPSWRRRGDYGTGFVAQAGFGRRESPLSSWRISARGEVFSRNPNYMSLGVDADYLLSMSTGMAGFNPDRVFDLSALVGVGGGIAWRSGPVRAMVEGRVGLHGSFRLSDALDFYIEPQLAANTMFYGSSCHWTPELRVMAGLKYKLGTPAGILSGLAAGRYADGRNFVSFTGGPTFFSSTFINKPHHLSGALDASVGRWFSSVSGMRIGYTADIITRQKSKGKRPYIHTAHADYLLNISSLMDKNPARRFHIIGMLGAGVGFSNLPESFPGLMLESGVQFRYNLDHGIDVHIEPDVSFYPNRVVIGYTSDARFVMIPRIMTGLSYRF